MRLNRIDQFLFGEYAANPANLALFRILFASCILAIYLPQHLWVPGFPSSFLDPPVGFALLFSVVPSAAVLIGLNALLILAAFSLLVGYHTRLASAGVGFLILLLSVWAYSFGKITHDIMLVLIPLVMQFSGWGDAYSADAQLRFPVHLSQNAWPLAILALLIGLAMVTAAEPKVVTGWLDPHTHAVRGHMLRNMVVEGRTGGLGAVMLRVKSGIFWEALDYATVLLEVAFLMTVLRRRAFRIVCALACIFHLAIALTMQISFWWNVLAYAAFCDWPALPSAGRASHALKALERLRASHVLVGSAAIGALYLTVGNPLKILALRFHPESDVILGIVVCLAAACVSAVFLGRQLQSGFTPSPRRVAFVEETQAQAKSA